MNSKTDKLKQILNDSNKEGADPRVLKQEAKDFLKTVDSTDLVMAEQALIDNGLDPRELRHLCAAHIELMGEQDKNNFEFLPDDHPLKTLMAEHDSILKYLEDLELINQEIQHCSDRKLLEPLLRQLEDVVDLLLQAEKHHQREEDVLFPEVVKRGMSGPPKIMEMEHNDLRTTKKAIYVLARSKIENIEKFKERLDQLASHLIHSLRDHIFKENNILYPSSLDLIIDQKVWASIKNKCDGIGYCCFTPGKQQT